MVEMVLDFKASFRPMNCVQQHFMHNGTQHLTIVPQCLQPIRNKLPLTVPTQTGLLNKKIRKRLIFVDLFTMKTLQKSGRYKIIDSNVFAYLGEKCQNSL